MENKTESKTKKWLPVLAHAAILIPGISYLVPLSIWIWDKTASLTDKNQTLQALTYQILHIVFIQVVLLLECIGLILFQFVNALLQPNLDAQRETLVLALRWAWGIFSVSNLFYILLGVLAAVQVLRGKDWLYPWFGKKISKNMASDDPAETGFETRLAAAMGHLGLFYGLTGIMVPFLTWIGAKERSVYLTYHNFQAIAVQAFAQIFTMVMVVFELFVLTPLFVGVAAVFNQSFDLSTVNGLIIFSLVLAGLGLVVFFLLHPLLAVFATIAAVRLLRNKPYDYPILGKMIKNRMNGIPDVQV